VCVNGVCVGVVVVRTGLAPFNCVTSNGVSTMMAEPSVRCDDGNGVHAMIKPWAAASLFVYGLGIPVGFGVILYRHRREIKADQELRARGEGNVPANNPNIRVRHKYRKLYEDFKPSLAFWKLVLIARKFGIAAVTMMLSERAMLQAALSAGVLFTSYVLQVRFRPFLPILTVSESFLSLASMGRERRSAVSQGLNMKSSPMTIVDATEVGGRRRLWYAKVLVCCRRNHRRSLVEGKRGVQGVVGTQSVDGEGGGIRLKHQRLGARPGSERSFSQHASSESARDAAIRAVKSTASRVIDYNGLETAFVMSAMLVLLSGMVFNSTAFSVGSPGYVVLTVVVCGVVIGTVVAFVGLVGFEVYRAIRFSGIHEAARLAESAATEQRVMAAANVNRGTRLDGTGKSSRRLDVGDVRTNRRAASGSSSAEVVSGKPPRAPLNRRTSGFEVENPLMAAGRNRRMLKTK
jgi:hypothetical protein